MALRIQPTPLAAQQIREEARWWRQNRTKAPQLFREELRRALKLIADYPEAGSLVEDAELRGVRRVLLAGTQHYLYYFTNTAEERIDLLAVWSTKRGQPPELKRDGLTGAGEQDG